MATRWSYTPKFLKPVVPVTLLALAVIAGLLLWLASGNSAGADTDSILGAATFAPTPTPTDTPTATPTPTPTPAPAPIKAKFGALVDNVDGLVGPAGLQISLRAKLNTALRLAQGDNPCASTNVLEAFINQAQASTFHSLLIGQAHNIIDQLTAAITCPPDPDTDADLMGDSAEVTLKTNPADRDTDADIASDGLELLETGSDPLVIDTDRDGCADGEEPELVNSDERNGGRRNPLSFWDFMDEYTGMPPSRNRTVSVDDIGALVARFGAQRGSPPTKQEALAEALAPPTTSTGYHASADRNGSIPGQDPWDLNPPNGVISIGDIGAVVVQFGHGCAAPL
jgi:hypothetical protein